MGWQSTLRRHVAQWRRSHPRAMLWRSVGGWVQGGVGTCGGRVGGGSDVEGGPEKK